VTKFSNRESEVTLLQPPYKSIQERKLNPNISNDAYVENFLCSKIVCPESGIWASKKAVRIRLTVARPRHCGDPVWWTLQHVSSPVHTSSTTICHGYYTTICTGSTCLVVTVHRCLQS